MRQLLFFFLFIFSGLTAIAQDHAATMYFNDGTDVAGYASIKFIKESFYGMPKDKISFRVSEDEEAELWDEETVSKIVFHDLPEPLTLEYINVTYVDGTQYSLFQVVEPGEITLYAEASTIWDTKTDKILPPMPKNLKVKRATEKEFAVLTNKKKISAYFQCQGITDRLDSGEFNSRTVVEMVNYYNESCTENLKEKIQKPASAGQ
ncbi:MAG: hypothetical protein DI539_22100 [Flavobacterium psychrophilum]|nr:MAG: hypothetical protein DI539_22100 [Flavobacterium psychrophilum]